MDRRTLLTFIVFFVLGCQGLKFTIDRDQTSVGQSSCAIVLCVTDAITSSTAASDQIEASASTSTVSSLTVFKMDQARSKFNSNTDEKSLLAIVTSIRPNTTQVSDRMKIDGHLTAKQAALRLELGQREDCEADFVCELSSTDGQGQSHETSSILLQRPVANREQRGEEMWTPALALQLFSLVHQLDTRIALITQSVAKWESKMNRLEDKLGHEINSFQQDVNAKFSQLQASRVSLERGLGAEIKSLEDSLKSNIEQRIVLLKTDVLNAHDSVEESLRWAENRLADKLNTIAEHCDSGVNHSDADRFVNGIKLFALINNTLLGISSNVVQIKNDIRSCSASNLATTQKIFNRLEENRSFYSNLSLQVRQNNMCNATQELNQRFLERVSMIQSRINAETQRLSSIVERSSTDSPCSGREFNTTTGAATIEQSRKNSTPMICTRGMAAVLPNNSPPYVVVDNSKAALETWEAPFLCDVVTDGGGWIVIQRRTTGDVDFFRGWNAYRRGFGTLTGDFWLGNERIHQITRDAAYELRVDLKYNNTSAFASYANFYLDSEAEKYALHLGPYHGTAGNSLSYHNNQPFSTRDQDNDGRSTHCSGSHRGAWWYNNKPHCHHSNLNGEWGRGGYDGPTWGRFSKGEPCSFTEMKIRKAR